MKQHLKKFATACKTFRRSEDGSSTLELMTVLPAAMIFFAASYETGTLGLRHMMLERAVDVTVREVRIGAIDKPDHAKIPAEEPERLFQKGRWDRSCRARHHGPSTQLHHLLDDHIYDGLQRQDPSHPRNLRCDRHDLARSHADHA